jgi:hypothetical protein
MYENYTLLAVYANIAYRYLMPRAYFFGRVKFSPGGGQFPQERSLNSRAGGGGEGVALTQLVKIGARIASCVSRGLIMFWALLVVVPLRRGSSRRFGHGTVK